VVSTNSKHDYRRELIAVIITITIHRIYPKTGSWFGQNWKYWTHCQTKRL